tara:strand:- start:613 stop:954 length:342 start_codon:yes stop_codon:yes gene_type:complete
MNNSTVIKWVQNTDVPIATIANNTGISRKTIHNIKAGKTARTSTLKKLYKASKTFPALFNSMKFFVGNFYHTIPIVYNVNNTKLITQCAVKIHWTEKPIRIETKSVILNKDNE